MMEPDFEAAAAYAVARLRGELPETLAYHCLAHTCNDVVPAVERLAAREGVTGEDLAVLRTAAYFHDIGFVEGYSNHEATGMRIAAAVLPRFGFSPAQVAAVTGMIRATRLPQQPQTHLEEILADADLDVLGREDFLPRNEALRAEMASLGLLGGDKQWYCGQLRFMETHNYFTAAARELRGARKQAHVAHLHARCGAAGRPPRRRARRGSTPERPAAAP